MGLAWAKWFCHHKFVEVQKMEILNKEGNVVEIKTLHLCTECGKFVTTQL